MRCSNGITSCRVLTESPVRLGVKALVVGAGADELVDVSEVDGEEVGGNGAEADAAGGTVAAGKDKRCLMTCKDA